MISRIYVVDDEWVIASTLASILKMNGFNARFFISPIEALEVARSVTPDLLISDVMMPEMTGVELATKLKEFCPDCKVLLFSGQAQTADLLKKARSEGHDFNLLTKPVHPKDLLAHVHDITG